MAEGRPVQRRRVASRSNGSVAAVSWNPGPSAARNAGPERGIWMVLGEVMAPVSAVAMHDTSWSSF